MTKVMQVGIIVADIETKAKAWADVLGLSVPEIIHHRYDGYGPDRVSGRVDAGVSQAGLLPPGPVDLEPIEPIDGPSTWKDQLDQNMATAALHHIAFVGFME